MNSTIAKRYAKALLAAAADDAERSDFEIELEVLAKGYLKTPLRAFLENPAFYLQERLDWVKNLKLNAKILRCLELLITSNRTTILPALFTAYRQELDIKLGRVRAKITTATSLTPEQLEAISQGLFGRLGKPVIPELVVDPRVLGGVRAQIGGLIFDGSLESQFSRVRRALCN